MQVGDLVKHKSTGALGILVEIFDSYASDVYNIHWMDIDNGYSGTYNSHFMKELEVVSATR